MALLARERAHRRAASKKTIGKAVGNAKLESDGKADKVKGKMWSAIQGNVQQPRAVMADQPSADIAALQTEIKQLRADFAQIVGTIRDLASDSVAAAGQQAQAQTEKVWTEVKRQADSVTREIEERPVAAALTAFGAGILLGLLLNRHRG